MRNREEVLMYFLPSQIYNLKKRLVERTDDMYCIERITTMIVKYMTASTANADAYYGAWQKNKCDDCGSECVC